MTYEAPDLAELLEKVRPCTMVRRESLIELAQQTSAVLAHRIPGNVVECGVWRGGAAFLMAEILKCAGAPDRKVWLFDSFEGLPPPEPIDGEAAMAVARSPVQHYDNCTAAFDDVQRSAVSLGLAAQIEMVKGWFDSSLPANRSRVGPIAILRIDADWYSSVRCCLENLYDQVVPGGLIVLDDYYTYDGCAAAVHEFLGSRKLPHRIEGLLAQADGDEFYASAVFRKGNTTWHWLRRLYLTGLNIRSIVPTGARFILVDADQLREQLRTDRQAVPFVERNGHYQGPPTDDQTAIGELERLRHDGAMFVFFAWPAFWWLDHYSGLRTHLESKYQRVASNDRLIAFDLRSL